MGFRWSEVQILSPRPTSLSGDRIPGPVSSLPPGVRRIKLSHCAFLLHSKVRGRPSVVCPFDRAVIHWIGANTPSHPLDILLFPPHPLAPINIAGNTDLERPLVGQHCKNKLCRTANADRRHGEFRPLRVSYRFRPNPWDSKKKGDALVSRPGGRENKSTPFLVRTAYSGVELIAYMASTAAGTFLEKRPNH